MDLDKLTPAPWWVQHEDSPGVLNASFIALARNAFDVMMRRGWAAIRQGNGWWVDATFDGSDDEDNWKPDQFQLWLHDRVWPDPFAALVEADRWYRENVEKP